MKVQIELDDNNFNNKYLNAGKVTTIEDNGACESKMLSISSIINGLNQSVVEELNLFRVGQLPNGFYDAAVQTSINGVLSGKVIIILPKHIYEMIYEKTSYKVCMPATVFYFKIINGIVTSTFVFAIKGKNPKAKSRLYVYPGGNVNTHSGQVCWGSNKLKKVKNLRQLNALCALFWGSPTSNDHFVKKESTNTEIDNLRFLFEYLKDYSAFPDKILVPKKNNFSTLGELTSELDSNLI